MCSKKFMTILALGLMGAVGYSSFASACCKPKFERTKPHVNVGTIGHVDHGKATGQTSAMGGFNSNFRRNKSNKRSRQELLILVTPTIVVE